MQAKPFLPYPSRSVHQQPPMQATNRISNSRRRLQRTAAKSGASDPPWANFLYENTNPQVPDRSLKEILDSKMSEPYNSFKLVPQQQQGKQQKTEEESHEAGVPCKGCNGSKKLVCHVCLGMGRTNHVSEFLLPKGVYPDWCSACKGCGLEKCGRCFGTGIKPPSVGFRVPV